MASSQRMLSIGIIWLTGVFALILMAYVGGMFYGYFLNIFAKMNIAPALHSGAGLMFWVLPLYYGVILISGIILTWRCYQETIVVADYFPDTGVY